jgi:DNA-binding transcriptional LysR family regulator
MDRLDEWRVFVTVASLRSFAGAARALGRSPQAVTRAVTAVEARLQTRLLNRTTRAVSLTDEGERALARGRRALAELELLEARDDTTAPLTGRVSVTAPVLLGELHVLPIVTELLAHHPGVDVRLVLLDRVVSLAEEGIDVAVRVGALPDSSLRARPIGHVREVLCASPAYLAKGGVPRAPEDLARHTCITFSGTTPNADRWSFRARPGGAGGPRRERSVAVRTRLSVNTGQAAIEAALAGVGLVRVLSYQVSRLVAAKRLRIVLAAFERDAIPVHVLHQPGPRGRAVTSLLELLARKFPARIS